jgi:hypothetical protein
MSSQNSDKKCSRFFLTFALTFCAALAAVTHASAAEHEDFDSYKFRISGNWFYSNPSGTIQGSADNGTIDVQKDLGFNSYSTFGAKADWKFTRKNHLYFAASIFDQTRDRTLARTFTFQGQTFTAGLAVNSELKSQIYAVGYQYDIIRRKRGHLGLGIQANIFDSTGTINAAAQAGNANIAESAKGSFLVPLPVAGPQYRLYLTDSPRFFIEGDLYGMYFFGYGNFISTANSVGVTINRHFSALAGYALGSRLVVNNSSSNNRIGVHLTQKGPTAGLQVSF